MKKRLLACVVQAIMIAVIASGMAESSEPEMGVHRAQQMVDQQIEKIQFIRDQADSEIAVAKLRMGEQLRRSQEDLVRQMQFLEEYREKLAEERKNAEEAIHDIRNSWTGMIDKASADVETGIQDANSLLTKIQIFDTGLGDESSAKNPATPCTGGGNQSTPDVSVQPPPQTADSSGQPPIRTAGG